MSTGRSLAARASTRGSSWRSRAFTLVEWLFSMRASSDNMEQTAREISMADDDGTNDRAPVARRDFLLGAGTAVAAGLAPASAGSAEQSSAAPPPAAAEPDAFVTLTAPE